MNKKWVFSLKILGILFVVLYSLMPLVNVVVSRYASTYLYMLLALCLFVEIVGKDLNYYVSFLLPMIVYELLIYTNTSNSIIMWGYQALLLILPIIISVDLGREGPFEINRTSKVLLFALFVTSLTTIVGCRIYPNAARTLATISDSQDELNVLYSFANIGGYTFVYELVLLYPLLIYAYKRGLLSTSMTVILSVVVGLVAISSEYTTALLLFIISSCLYFVKKDFTIKDAITLAILGIIFIVIFDTVISSLLLKLADVIESDAISYRLETLAGGSEALEASEDNRILLYGMSLSSFFNSPLWGKMLGASGSIGGHSQILDALGNYGLIGGLTLFFIYRRIYNYFYEPVMHKAGDGYIFWMFFQAVFLSTINTGLFLEVLAFYGPLLFNVINLKLEDRNEDLMGR